MASIASWLALSETQSMTTAATSGSDKYQFRFTAIRSVEHDIIQLGEVVLYDYLGRDVEFTAVSNPDGVSPSDAEGPASAIDKDLTTKWLDSDFGDYVSTLVLTLKYATAVVSYELYTAADVPAGHRDPVSWEFGILRDDGTFEVLSTYEQFDPTYDRSTSYGMMYTIAPPSPPAPPMLPPPLPPSPPPPSPPTGSVKLYTAGAGGLEELDIVEATSAPT